MRFNTAATTIDETYNLAGGGAFKTDPRYELAAILLTSFVKDKFYQTSTEEVERLRKLLRSVMPEFAAKAAIFARNEFKMRSITHVLGAELARYMNELRTNGILIDRCWQDRFYAALARRPDDMLEMLAYYHQMNGGTGKLRKIPSAMKRGFAHRLAKLDEYQLAKYKAEGKQISLVDLVNLVHPRSTPALAKLMKGTLPAADTWNNRLSAAGQDADSELEKAELKKEAWVDMLAKGNLPYMALLMNLRNIIEQAPNAVQAVCDALTNREAIKHSMVLPFRFATAWAELQKSEKAVTRSIMPALAKACDIALENCPRFMGRTLIALDKSGSMSAHIKVASMFAAAIYKHNDAALMLFDDTAQALTVNPELPCLSVQQTILGNCGRMGGTNFDVIFDGLKEKFDRVIILSDMQAWAGGKPLKAFERYKARMGCSPLVYSMDLAGYGSLQFPQRDVFALAGWSEKIFDLMNALEVDPEALILQIESVSL